MNKQFKILRSVLLNNGGDTTSTVVSGYNGGASASSGSSAIRYSTGNNTFHGKRRLYHTLNNSDNTTSKTTSDSSNKNSSRYRYFSSFRSQSHSSSSNYNSYYSHGNNSYYGYQANQQHQNKKNKGNNNNEYKYEQQNNNNNNNSNNNSDASKLKTLGVLLSPTFLLTSNSNGLTAPLDAAAVAADPLCANLKGMFGNPTMDGADEINQQQEEEIEQQEGRKLMEEESDHQQQQQLDQQDQQEENNNIVEEQQEDESHLNSTMLIDEVEPNHTNGDVVENQEELEKIELKQELENNNNHQYTVQQHQEEQQELEENEDNQQQDDEETLELTNRFWSRGGGISKSKSNDGPFQGNGDDDGNNNNNGNNNGGDDPFHLHSGVCVIPHPNKRHKGGEDAHFISNDLKVMGVADGVGGWGDVGIDPSLYSNTLMEGSKLASNDLSSRHPVEIMERGYVYSQDIKGSSTCCIIVLDHEELHFANLGDSGFIIIREGDILYRTREQQHAFNMPYQLGTQSIDRPIHSITASIDIEKGDVIVLGTDGVFDNLFDEEICRITMKYKDEPQTIARMIAKRAYEVGNSNTIFTPFAKNAGLNGYLYNGGKLDDITVLVGIVSEGPCKPIQSDILLDEEFLGEPDN